MDSPNMRKIIYILAAFHIIITCNLFSQQSGWVWQNPLPQGNSIFYIKMFDINTGICINSESILRTSDAAGTWTQIYTDFPGPNLSISKANESTFFLLVDSSSLIKSTDKCITWNFIAGNEILKNSFIYFYDVNTGFAVKNEYFGFEQVMTIFRTTNGGIKWENKISADSITITSLEFINSQTGFASGMQYISNEPKAKIFKTTDGGNLWDTLANAFSLYNPAMYFVNSNTGYLYSHFGTPKIYRTTNVGINWILVNYFWSGGISKICFIDSLIGFVLEGSRVDKTTNGGINWVAFPQIPGGGLHNDIDFVNITTGYVTGYHGEIFKTTDSGINWNLTAGNNFFNAELWQISFADNNTGFAIADYGKMLRTTNGGTNWELRQFDPGLDFSAIAKVNANLWYVSSYWGGKIFKTSDSGISWDTTYANVDDVTRLEFINAQTGFGICKYFTFFKTTNGGVNWAVTSPFGGFNYAMDFIDENTGFVCGSGGKLDKTTNGGVTWTRYFPLPYDYDAKDMQFVNYNTGYIGCITGYDRPENGVLKTTDGGITWFHCMRGNTFIFDIYFVNERIGFALSQFRMFKTTNGGDNWFNVGIFTTALLNSVEFSDSLTGWLAGDNGVIRKTTNGGGTPIGIVPISNEIPNAFNLSQNYPNPFNPTTKIEFMLPQRIMVTIKIYNILGQLIKTALNEFKEPGKYSVTFEGSSLASGVYFYSIETEIFTQTKKMVLLK